VFFSARKNEEASRIQSREDFRQLLDLAEQKFETERVKQKSEPRREEGRRRKRGGTSCPSG